MINDVQHLFLCLFAIYYHMPIIKYLNFKNKAKQKKTPQKLALPSSGKHVEPQGLSYIVCGIATLEHGLPFS